MVAFGKFRREKINDERDGKKYKPIEQSNTNWEKNKKMFGINQMKQYKSIKNEFLLIWEKQKDV